MATATETREVSQPTTPAIADSAGIDLDWLAKKIDYRLYQDCVHCGLCTASCPTYVETGDENDSPRGRIYLMRAVADRRLEVGEHVRGHLELCLDCRACETACPSGVQYGRLIEPFKVALKMSESAATKSNPIESLILQHLFPYSGRVKFALAPAKLLQRLGVLDAIERSGLLKILPSTLGRMATMLPRFRKKSTSGLAEVMPAIGVKRARVALFLGCVADAMFPETNAATARVLRRNGCEVVVPRGQVCCGAIHYHSGVEGPAIDFARQNMKIFLDDSIDAVITNAAGCGAMLKDYAHLVPAADRARAERFVSKVRDISEYLVELGPIAPANGFKTKVAYHDACHLCHAQRIRTQPRELLAMIPGIDLVPLEESELCCGAAGTYNLVQPEMADRLGKRKVDQIAATGAEVVAAGNVGCILQIERKIKERGLKIEVAHPVDLLDRAYENTSRL
jgi:glycolate oxidase iron-sulfur subunit